MVNLASLCGIMGILMGLASGAVAFATRGWGWDTFGAAILMVVLCFGLGCAGLACGEKALDRSGGKNPAVKSTLWGLLYLVMPLLTFGACTGVLMLVLSLVKQPG